MAKCLLPMAAIKAKTDNLPSDPASQSAVASAITSATTGLATASALSTLSGYVDTEAAAIKAVTDKLDTTMVLDGSVYQFTTNALENASSAGDVSVTVYPLNASDVERVNESTIITYLKEVVPVSVPVTGEVDLTTKTLQIVIEKANAIDKVVIANNSIDRTATTFTFTVPQEVTADLDQFSWILREVGTNIKLAGGRLLVKYAPFADES